MAECLRPSSEGQAPQGHLVYILVESAETWALEAEDKEGKPVCPYLQEYIRSHPMLYVPGVVSLQRYGRSGDGQLICQTGLLPISHGVACRQYGTNTYPNLAHFYEDGIVLNPYRIPVWNQEEVTYSYGFRQLQGTHKFRNEKDSVVLERTRACLERATKPTAVLTLTIDTHTPFQSAQDSIAIDERYSPIEQAYLRSMHYTDRQIGRFLAWADTAKVMKNATIVITADHNHFPREDGKGICPLIVVSPAIKEYKTIPEALQMDLFPTVLHAIDQCDYAWKGFGIDLLDEKADSLLEARPISVQEAYLLSDKLICTNFFAK